VTASDLFGWGQQPPALSSNLWVGQFYYHGLIPSVGFWTYKSQSRAYNSILTSENAHLLTH